MVGGSFFSGNGIVTNVRRYLRTIDAPYSNGANATRFNPPKEERNQFNGQEIGVSVFRKG